MSFTPGRVYASLPPAQRGTSLVINGDPKGKNFLYTCGRTVFIRDIENPGIVDTYTQHSVPATVAKYAPSGFYVASGDQSGKVRIWDTTQKEHILKHEYQPISGAIKDIVWDGESKRIAVCGEGREKFGHVFLWDSGSSVGDIIGHSKAINAIDLKQTRPFRVVTAGEDNLMCWYEGPPFRFKRDIKEHTRFVNAIRFSPNGERACSGSADGTAVLLDGKTGDVIGKLGEGGKAHAGGIYSLSWSPDSRQVLTASGDKSCKIFDVETSQVVTEFKMGAAIEDQQVSCLWQGDYLLSVSVSGHINYLDRNNPGVPHRILKGHNKNITSMAVSPSTNTLYTGCYTGRVTSWVMEGDEQELVAGKQHTNEIRTIQAVGDQVYTLGYDKALRSFPQASNEFSSVCLVLDGLDPVDAVVSEDRTAVVATKTSIVVAKDNTQVSALAADYEPQCVSRHPSRPEYAVGGKDSKVHVLSLSGSELSEDRTVNVSAEVSAVAYSPDGQYLAAAHHRTVTVHSVADGKVIREFLVHLSRVTALAWSPDSQRVASGSIDTNVAVCSVVDDSTKVCRGAHPLATVTAVQWVSNSTLLSAGHDVCVRTWEV